MTDDEKDKLKEKYLMSLIPKGKETTEKLKNGLYKHMIDYTGRKELKEEFPILNLLDDNDGEKD